MNRRGFTLIELLVVIAIIAILAAILFPVFAQARESARKTQCLSNTKQLALGFMQYTQDYDEKFPGWNWGARNTMDSSGFWTDAIYPYVKNVGVYKCPSDGLEWPLPGDWVNYGPDAGQHCRFATWSDRNWWDKPNNPNYVSYGMNESIGGGKKLAQIARPANYSLLMDSSIQLVDSWQGGPDDQIAARAAFSNQGCCLIWDSGHNMAWFNANRSKAEMEGATRHQLGNNVAYCDGHAKYLRYDKMNYAELCPNN